MAMIHHNFAEATHFLCVDIQKWVSKNNLTWCVQEEFAYFTVTSEKRTVFVHPKTNCIEIKNEDVITKISYKEDLKRVLEQML
jgi:hypothetical protein